MSLPQQDMTARTAKPLADLDVPRHVATLFAKLARRPFAGD
jgi:hypothetical protein